MQSEGFGRIEELMPMEQRHAKYRVTLRHHIRRTFMEVSKEIGVEYPWWLIPIILTQDFNNLFDAAIYASKLKRALEYRKKCEG